jgi:hypothetical protein
MISPLAIFRGGETNHMISIFESLQNLFAKLPKKKEHIPLLKNEKEILRLRILRQTLRG